MDGSAEPLKERAVRHNARPNGALLDAAVEARTSEAVGLLERLVAVPSGLGAEREAQDVLAAALEALGFGIERLAVSADIVDDAAAGIPQVSYDDRTVVVARRPGSGGGRGVRSLLINGHLDVVPAGARTRWSSDPYALREDGGWLVGRGAGDMKGGLAMAVLAMAAVLDVDSEALAGDLTVVGVIEEECTGNGTLASVRAGILADAVVLPEPTGLDLLTSGIGVLWLEAVLEGAGGHAEGGEQGPGVFDAAVAFVEELRDVEASLNPTADGPRHRINVGRVEVGEWPSSVPGTARLMVRVGFPTGWTVEQAERHVRDAIAAATRDRPALAAHPPRLRPAGFRAEGYALDPGAEVLDALGRAHADAHGDRPAIVGTNATTDARFYLLAGVPALCFGPQVRGMHGSDEAVELRSIVDGARTLARFLVDWLAHPSARAPE